MSSLPRANGMSKAPVTVQHNGESCLGMGPGACGSSTMVIHEEFKKREKSGFESVAGCKSRAGLLWRQNRKRTSPYKVSDLGDQCHNTVIQP